MSKGHSKIGASSAHRWFNCPGSVALSEFAPPQKSSEHANRGTAAHTVLEECFQTEKDPWNYEGMEFEGGELNEADIEAVVEALDFLYEKLDDVEAKYNGVKTLVEVSFDLSRIHDDLWGTSDVVIYTEDLSFLGVYDYKHGSGKWVGVENNTQLLYYVLGAINFVAHKHIDVMGWGNVFREMEMGILQPRKENIAVVSISADEVNDFAVLLNKKAEETRTKKETFKAGDHCRWCRAQPMCPQLYNQTLEVAKTDFGAINPQPPEAGALTNAQLGHVLENEEVFTSWLKSIRGLALQKLERGEHVPGFKLVKKKANRVWSDEAAAIGLLVDLGHPSEALLNHKLKSPAQMEKFIQKEDIEHLVTKPNNGNTIASENDRRKAVVASAITDFERK